MNTTVKIFAALALMTMLTACSMQNAIFGKCSTFSKPGAFCAPVSPARK